MTLHIYGARNSQNGMISGPRNRQKMMLSGPRKHHYGPSFFLAQKSSKWDYFWAQKSSIWPREPLWVYNISSNNTFYVVYSIKKHDFNPPFSCASFCSIKCVWNLKSMVFKFSWHQKTQQYHHPYWILNLANIQTYWISIVYSGP